MENKSVKKNFLYNLIYQVIILILPIITTPYISRVLGAENVGIYSFTIANVTYFILFGTLGVSMYGQREIAYVRDNPSERKKAFFEIISFRIITMLISMTVFFFMFTINNEYKQYYQILLLYLFAIGLDISWFFQGLEEFKKTVTRNVLVRIISVGCIFIFVRTHEDLWKYLLIYSLADFLGNLSLWFYLPKYFKGVKIKNITLIKHIFPIILLFIPQIASRVYGVMDRTMIGYMISEKAELGNYEEAYKVINVLFTVASSLGLVMVPRIASIFASGDKEQIKVYINKSFRFIYLLAFPMTIGIIAVAKEFVPIFLGAGYEQAVSLIYVLAPIILLCGISNVLGIQYLLPTKKQKEYTISILAGLIVNFIFNLILIPIAGAFGAAIITSVSQVIVIIVQVLYAKREINIKEGLLSGKNYCIASIIMLLVCIVLGLFIKNSAVSLIVKMLAGGTTYAVVLILLKDKYVYEVRDIIKARILKR